MHSLTHWVMCSQDIERKSADARNRFHYNEPWSRIHRKNSNISWCGWAGLTKPAGRWTGHSGRAAPPGGLRVTTTTPQYGNLSIKYRRKHGTEFQQLKRQRNKGVVYENYGRGSQSA